MSKQIGNEKMSKWEHVGFVIVFIVILLALFYLPF